jgi:hypothetical protein
MFIYFRNPIRVVVRLPRGIVEMPICSDIRIYQCHRRISFPVVFDSDQPPLKGAHVIAGHKYVSTTERYEVSNLEDFKEQLRKHYPLG